MDSHGDKMELAAPLPDPSRITAAKRRLREAEQTVASWARDNGESQYLTYRVLSGRRPCLMGASRRIAVKLGIIDERAALAAIGVEL